MCYAENRMKGSEPSAAANSNNNFKLVAIFDLSAGMLATGHDFSVAFDRDAFSGKLKRNDQPGDRKRSIELARIAIDENRNHENIFPDRKTLILH